MQIVQALDVLRNRCGIDRTRRVLRQTAELLGQFVIAQGIGRGTVRVQRKRFFAFAVRQMKLDPGTKAFRIDGFALGVNA
jgi:hypothetical protein